MVRRQESFSDCVRDGQPLLATYYPFSFLDCGGFLSARYSVLLWRRKSKLRWYYVQNSKVASHFLIRLLASNNWHQEHLVASLLRTLGWHRHLKG